MKYETIKTKVKQHITHEFQSLGFDLSTHAIRLFLDNHSYDKAKQDALSHALSIVDNWDVRCVGSLLKIFPKVYPRMTDKRLMIDVNDSGDWVVELYK